MKQQGGVACAQRYIVNQTTCWNRFGGIVILGLTGSFGSGCTTVREYLADGHGFISTSLSDILKNEASKHTEEGTLKTKSKKGSRSALQFKGNELRKANPYHLVDSILQCVRENYESGKDVVIDSIRNDKEVKRLRQLFPDFLLLAIDASQATRWIRCKNDYENEDQFNEDDFRDSGDEEPQYGQKVRECVHLADILIYNDVQFKHPSDWNSLHNKVDECLRLVRFPGYRVPFPNEYYMAQAYAASLNSSCTRRKVGAVVVSANNSEIISSGYNDVPGGLQKCRDLGNRHDYCYRREETISRLQRMGFWPCCGKEIAVENKGDIPWKCPDCKVKLPDAYVPGKMLDLCRALHAEEDAILQAAKLGSLSLKGCILYTTTFPCALCAKMIVDVGILKVVYVEPYPMSEAVDILQNSHPYVEMEKYEGVQGRAFYKLFESANV